MITLTPFPEPTPHEFAVREREAALQAETGWRVSINRAPGEQYGPCLDPDCQCQGDGLLCRWYRQDLVHPCAFCNAPLALEPHVFTVDGPAHLNCAMRRYPD